jgi:Ca-activated chloride channel family protein
MHFLSPIWLLLLVLVAALVAAYVVRQLQRKKYVARFSNVELLGSVAPRRPGWRRHLTFAILLIGLTVLSFGAARPSAAVRVPRDRATVMLDIDVSLSMEATDVLPSRIKAAQKAGRQFADLLPARINLGLISFARNANVLVPPTLARDPVKQAISSLHLANYTAIGEAIFSSLDAIRVFSQATTAKGDSAPPARIVLLSDGSNTVGRSIADAIVAAKRAHVEISTIAFGTPNGTVETPNGEAVPVPADDSALSQIATKTGGTFHTATSAQELESVYKDIGSQIGYTTSHRDISSQRSLAQGCRCSGRPASSRSFLRVEDELADRTAVEQRTVCLAGLVERVGLSDDGAQRPVREPLQQVIHGCCKHRRALHDVHEPEPDHRLAAREQLAGIDGRRRLPSRLTERDETSERGECREALVEHLAPGHLEDDVDLVTLVRLAQCAGQVVGTRVDGGVSTEVHGQLALLLTRGRRDDPAGSPAASELDGDRADSAGAGVDDDGLLRLEMRRGPQQMPRGRTLYERGQRVPVVDVVGYGEERAQVGRDLLGVAAAGKKADHPLAIRTAHDNLAAGDHGQCLRREVGVLRLMGVGVVHSGGQHVEHLLPFAGDRVGDLADD